MAGFPSALLLLLLAFVGCVSVLGQPQFGSAGIARRSCRPLFCRRFCPFGFQVDFRGCRICRCRRPFCRPVRCFRFCPGGFRFINGCQTCQCRIRRCPLRCRFCPFGLCFGCPPGCRRFFPFRPFRFSDSK